MKKINDFPDLKEHPYHFIKLQHFKDGLDINSFTNDKSYVHVGEESFEQPQHMLEFLLRRTLNPAIGDNQDELYEFTKKSFLSLKNIVPQELMNRMAMYAIEKQTSMDFVDFMIGNKLIDANMKYRGYTLLMNTKEKRKIDRLISLGCDVTARVETPDAPWFNQTIYDVALKSKKKGWIEYLKPYICEDILNSDGTAKLEEFRNASKASSQLKLYWTSLREKNYFILEDILNNQAKYQKLIEYRDGLGKNLISYAVNQNSNDVLEKLLDIDYYKNNKSEVYKNAQCYTSNAVKLNKNLSAKILYQAGFKNDDVLRKFMEHDLYSPMPSILNMMIDDGYKPSLDLRFTNDSAYKLENEKFTKNIIDDFFKQHHYIFKLKDFNGRNIDNGDHTRSKINKGILDIVCVFLQKQKDIDKSSFDTNLAKFLGAIGQNEQKVSLGLAACVSKHFPDLKILDYLGFYEKRAWLTELNHEKLEKALAKFDDKPVVKKMKI